MPRVNRSRFFNEHIFQILENVGRGRCCAGRRASPCAPMGTSYIRQPCFWRPCDLKRAGAEDIARIARDAGPRSAWALPVIGETAGQSAPEGIANVAHEPCTGLLHDLPHDSQAPNTQFGQTVLDHTQGAGRKQPSVPVGSVDARLLKFISSPSLQQSR